MQGWKNKLLSHAGREVLIKAVVQAIPSYAMACFSFSNSFCNKLNMAIRNFWWKGDPTNKGIPWTKWETMCSSKLHGGMGFRDFSAFNQAMLTKQGWRCITNPHSFWSRLLKGLYFPHSNFLNAPRGARGSWAWHSLLHGRELLKKGIRWQIQNGASTLFWEDKWIPETRNCQLSTPPPTHSPIVHVSDVIDPIHKRWRMDLLCPLVSRAECRVIQSIPLSYEDRVDVLVWHPSKFGVYSVKSAYGVATSLIPEESPSHPSSSHQVPKDFWKQIWKVEVPPKIKHFWWRVCKNTLATKVNLHHRHCSPSSVYPICLSEAESIEHLLFDCAWTKSVWFGSKLNLRIDKGMVTNVVAWTANWFAAEHEGRAECKVLNQVFLIGWYIWKARNDFIFNHIPVHPSETLSKIARAWFEGQEQGTTDLISNTVSPRPACYRDHRWHPPWVGAVKFNCDASFRANGEKASAAVLLRNSDGHLLDGLASVFYSSSSFAAEAQAVRLAAQMATASHLDSAIIESDNQKVIKLAVSEQVPPWETLAIFLDIRHLARQGNL